MQRKFFVFLLIVLTGFVLSCSTAVSVLIKIEPSNHNYGQVNIGTTATFDFIISNKKSVDITLTIVSFLTGEFSEITNAQGKTIAAKGNLTITVRFAPAMPGGSKSDTMHIEWTDINGKTGKKDVSLNGEAVPVPIIIAPTTFDFGTVGIGQTASHNLNIENTGSGNLILSLFSFNGNATLFSITAGGSVPVTVLAGATHTVTVQFAPTATGSFPTVLEISHNAVNTASPATINITAAGGGGRIELNKTSPWDFGQAKSGGSTTNVLEVSNTGSINLNINSITLTTGTVFTIDSVKNSSGNPITAPFAITPSDFAKVTIKFSPTAVTNYNDTLSIANDGSYAASPATLNLTGTGRAPITQTFNYTGAIVNWNVPAGSGSATIEVWGAQGGDVSLLSRSGGLGARMKGDFTLTPGETLKVLVGQKGMDVQYVSGGGGGSFVTRSTNDPMIIGGGGGGTIYQVAAHAGIHATTSGTGNSGYNGTAGGSNGNGGSSTRGGGGGGLLTDGGEQADRPATKGKAFVNGGAGGSQWVPDTNTGGGGFGGGGAAIRRNNNINDQGAGGGGGYSGGGGDGSSNTSHGGGGGSFNNGTNQSNSGGIRSGNGEIQIAY